MVDLKRPLEAIREHLQNLFEDGELSKNSVVKREHLPRLKKWVNKGSKNDGRKHSIIIRLG